jgi:hypothetical protein
MIEFDVLAVICAMASAIQWFDMDARRIGELVWFWTLVWMLTALK